LNNFSNFPISNLLQFKKVIWCPIFHQAKFWAIFHFSCLFEKNYAFSSNVIFLQFFEVICCLVFHQANFCLLFYFSSLFGHHCRPKFCNCLAFVQFFIFPFYLEICVVMCQPPTHMNCEWIETNVIKKELVPC
jgi:hypothetical protein